MDDRGHFALYPSLRGKVVLVTGGASGIGAAIVEAFVAQRARVAFLDIQKEIGETLVQRLAIAGATGPEFYLCDLTDIASLQKTVATIVETFGGINVLVNSASNDIRHSIEEVTSENGTSRLP